MWGGRLLACSCLLDTLSLPERPQLTLLTGGAFAFLAAAGGSTGAGASCEEEKTAMSYRETQETQSSVAILPAQDQTCPTQGTMSSSSTSLPTG
jgi:hypothetical protein